MDTVLVQDARRCVLSLYFCIKVADSSVQVASLQASGVVLSPNKDIISIYGVTCV